MTKGFCRLGIGEKGFNTLYANEPLRALLGSTALRDIVVKYGSKVIKQDDEMYIRIVPELAGEEVQAFSSEVQELIAEKTPEVELKFEIRSIPDWNVKENAAALEPDDEWTPTGEPDAAE